MSRRGDVVAEDRLRAGTDVAARSLRASPWAPGLRLRAGETASAALMWEPGRPRAPLQLPPPGAVRRVRTIRLRRREWPIAPLFNRRLRLAPSRKDCPVQAAPPRSARCLRLRLLVGVASCWIRELEPVGSHEPLSIHSEARGVAITQSGYGQTPPRRPKSAATTRTRWPSRCSHGSWMWLGDAARWPDFKLSLITGRNGRGART